MITRAEWDAYTDEQKWEYTQMTDKQNDAMTEVLNLIPECPEHGFCLPHMSDWIKAQQLPIVIVQSVEQEQWGVNPFALHRKLITSIHDQPAASDSGEG